MRFAIFILSVLCCMCVAQCSATSSECTIGEVLIAGACLESMDDGLTTNPEFVKSRMAYFLS